MMLLFLVALLGLSLVVHADDRVTATGQALPLETFDGYQLLAFPGQWKVRGDENQAREIYRIAEENGNHFLHAHADNNGVQIGLSHTFQPKEFPLLRWRWRAEQLPSGADERAAATNDSAAAVYVVFDSRLLPRAIKYVWSSTLLVGMRMDSPTYWRAKVVVLQSGSANPGEWRQETVNLYEDYKKLFGFEPGEAQGIAVLTDSDTTRSVADAAYDDFVLLPAGALPAEEASGPTAHLAPAVAGKK